jgi:hypothetical protein
MVRPGRPRRAAAHVGSGGPSAPQPGGDRGAGLHARGAGAARQIGKPGTGKSHVAKALAYHAVQQGLKVAYIEADSDFAGYALAQAREREQVLQRLLAADLLVLDDLFLAKRVSEAAAELLQTLVHQRYRRRASVLVTSNRVIKDWGSYLGDVTNGLNHPGPSHAPLAATGVRGQELPAERSGAAPRAQGGNDGLTVAHPPAVDKPPAHRTSLWTAPRGVRGLPTAPPGYRAPSGAGAGCTNPRSM